MNREQIKRALDEGVSRIWRDLSEQFGLPVPIPDANRRDVDKDFEHEFRTATCEADVEEALADYQEVAERTVAMLAVYVSALDEKGLLRKSPYRKSAGSRRYEKGDLCWRALAFVAQREVSLQNLLRRSLETSARIAWKKRLYPAWNARYPGEIASCDTFKRYYSRARETEGLQEEFFDEYLGKWKRWKDRAGPILRMLKESGRGLTDLHIEFAAGSRVKDWAKLSARIPRERSAVLRRATARKCGLMACTVKMTGIALSDFCVGPECRRCRVGAGLQKEGLVSADELSGANAIATVKTLGRNLRLAHLLRETGILPTDGHRKQRKAKRARRTRTPPAS
jgi:hypothetical protein